MAEHSIYQMIQEAQKAANEAYHKKNDASNQLEHANDQLQIALDMAKDQINNSHLIQQIHEAQNAIAQAKNAASQIATNENTALESIEQAVRACNQIQV